MDRFHGSVWSHTHSTLAMHTTVRTRSSVLCIDGLTLLVQAHDVTDDLSGDANLETRSALTLLGFSSPSTITYGATPYTPTAIATPSRENTTHDPSSDATVATHDTSSSAAVTAHDASSNATTTHPTSTNLTGRAIPCNLEKTPTYIPSRGRARNQKTTSWRTPPEIITTYRQRYGFGDFDPCPYNPSFDPDLHFDGLKIEWPRSTFVNPPYGHETITWVRKAHEEWQKGKTVVLLLKAATDTQWFHEYLAPENPYGHKIEFLQGRLKFLNDEREATHSGFASMVAIMETPIVRATSHTWNTSQSVRHSCSRWDPWLLLSQTHDIPSDATATHPTSINLSERAILPSGTPPDTADINPSTTPPDLEEGPVSPQSSAPSLTSSDSPTDHSAPRLNDNLRCALRRGDLIKIICGVDVYRWNTPEFKATREAWAEMFGGKHFGTKDGKTIPIPVDGNVCHCACSYNSGRISVKLPGDTRATEHLVNIIHKLGKVRYVTIVCEVVSIDWSKAVPTLACKPCDPGWGCSRHSLQGDNDGKRDSLRTESTWDESKLGPDPLMQKLSFKVSLATKGVRHYVPVTSRGCLTYSSVHAGGLGHQTTPRRRLQTKVCEYVSGRWWSIYQGHGARNRPVGRGRIQRAWREQMAVSLVQRLHNLQKLALLQDAPPNMQTRLRRI